MMLFQTSLSMMVGCWMRESTPARVTNASAIHGLTRVVGLIGVGVERDDRPYDRASTDRQKALPYALRATLAATGSGALFHFTSASIWL